MPNLRVRFAALTLVALAGGCRGCKEDREKVDAVAVGLPNEDLPRKLEPLPEPPKLQIDPEALPGAGEDLAVVAARPQGPVQGEVRPTVTFSKPVKSLEMVEAQRAADQEKPFAKIEPPLEGEWRWLGSASAEFVPKGLVPYSTAFQVTVLSGLRAIDGSELKQPYTFAFETPRLTLQDVSPAREFRWMKPDDEVKLLFNQPVKEADLEAAMSFEVQEPKGQAQKLRARVVSRISIAEERRQAEEQARREGRHYERMGWEERGFKNQQTRYVVVPEKRLPLNAQVRLRIDGSLHGEQGPLPMEDEVALAWRTYGPLELTEARFCHPRVSRCPYGPLVVLATNQVDVKSLEGKVSISPPVELDWERASSWAPHAYYDDNETPYVAIPGRFKPGTTYQVKIAAGAADVFGQTHGRPLEASIRTDDLLPSLQVGSRLGLIERASGPKLPVEVVNLKQLDVSLWSLSTPELVRLLSRVDRDDKKAVSRPPDFTAAVPLSYAKNQSRVHPVDLSPALTGRQTGAVMARLYSPELRHGARFDGYRTIVQVTDLAAHIKVAPKKSLAWVTRLSTGEPVAGATVTVYDASGAQQWQGTTGPDGFCDVPGTVELKLPDARYSWEYPFVAMAAEKDGDVSVTASTWTSGVEPYEFGLASGWEGTSPQSYGFVFTDRGVYRPGDKVYLKGVTRFRQVGELKVPKAGSSMTLTVTDSRGEQVSSQNVTLSRYGTFSAELELKPASPTGYFSVEARGSAPGGTVEYHGSFRVEEYRAPQFKVDVEAPRKDLSSGDRLEGTIYARYLFGGPMSNARAKWSVHRSETAFAPEAGKGFTFSHETWWWDDERPRPASGFFASGEGLLDAKGALRVEAGAVEAPGEKTYTYTLEAEVEDVNRQTVAGRAAITVHPSAYYVGLRPPTGFMQAGHEYAMDALVLDVAGRRVKGRKVSVGIWQRTWKSVKKKDAGGGFVTVSEPVETEVHRCELESGDGPVSCRFKPPSAGFYLVKARVTDEQKRTHSSSMGVYATGPGFVAWQRNDTDRIDLLPDKTSYDVGEVAKVLVKSPYPEARAMLTIEREGVLERRMLQLQGSVETVEVPITEEMVPNVYVGVLITRPRVAEGGIETGDDPGRPAARVGLVALNVERKTRRLAVDLKTERAEYRPGEEVSVDITLKDHAGKPASAEVTLYVVDEAVLRLTDYQTPDPIALIYPTRPLSVRIGEPLVHLVRRRNYGEKGEEQGGGGGGGGEGKGFRSSFKTTVAFLPNVEVSGRTQVKVKLPDNLTQFRIMAVAVSDADRFGSGETSIRVNKPLLALPALPRFAHVGDTFEAGVVVHSYGGGAGETTVTAFAENAQLLEKNEKKVFVAEGAPKEVRFRFTVSKPGVATFRFRAKKGGFEDGVEQKIPIELPVALEAVATYGDTKDVRVEGVVPPADVWTDLGGLEVTMASTALGNFQEGFRQLVEYPYGCLEQQTSRLIPFIALRELSGQFGVSWPQPDRKKLAQQAEINAWLRTYLFDTLDVTSEKDPDQVIAKTVEAILSLQDHDGGFRYWPSSFCRSAWASAYATLALHRAREVGFDVPPERLSRAEGYLTRVAGGQCSICEGCDWPETRVMAAWVLARIGRPKPSYYDQFFKQRNQLPLFARAQIADMMFIGGGDRAQARQVLQEILNHGKESPKGLHFEEVHAQTYATLWHSDTRTTGLVLMTLTDISPDHPYVSKIARYLTGVRQGDGKWRSTQEAAFSLMGLTELVRTKERETPDFVASLTMGSSSLMQETFKGRSMAVRAKRIGIDELLEAAGGQKQTLSFKKEGPGVLYYSALLKYAPKQLPMKPIDAGLFVQRWFEPYSGGGQSTRFYAGDLVRVRVRVGTNQERHWAAFEVPLPAGLEPVDTTLATTARQTRSPDAEEMEGYEYESDEDQFAGSAYEEERQRDIWAYTFWSPFNHTERRDRGVVLFADHLPPGVHTASFVARATTPGKFLLKPASGQLMYEPEVFGRSEGGELEVVLPSEVASR